MSEAILENNNNGLFILKELLEKADKEAIIEFIENEHAADIAGYLSALSTEEAVLVLDMLSLDLQASILDYCSTDYILEISRKVEPRKLAKIINLMSHDDRADILKDLPEDLANEIIGKMVEGDRDDVKNLLSYPEGTAGSIMTTEYATIQCYQTVESAIDSLRSQASEREMINYAYVTDHEEKLLGYIKIQSLIFSNPKIKISEIMEENIPSVQVTDSKEYVAQQIARYDVISLPVLDEKERLVGVVTHDDALDVIEQETTEDFHKSGTVGGISANINQASGWLLYRKRITWLIILVFGNIFSGAGIEYFQTIITTYVSLLFFLPLLIGSAGNAGSQSATLMVRALATGSIVLKDWRKMLGKELLVASGLGITMAIAISFVSIFRVNYDIAMVVAITMILVVVVGSLIGMLLPFLLSKLGLDPATASAPLIASISDVTGVIIYFKVASIILVI